MTGLFYRNAQICLYFVSLEAETTDPVGEWDKKLRDWESWQAQVRENCPQDVRIMCVGTKRDTTALFGKNNKFLYLEAEDGAGAPPGADPELTGLRRFLQAVKRMVLTSSREDHQSEFVHFLRALVFASRPPAERQAERGVALPPPPRRPARGC